MTNFEKLNISENTIMANQLFNEFHSHTKEQWKQQAVKELKGKNFDEMMVWNIDKNIQIEPYYASEEIDFQSTKNIQQAQNQRVNSNWNYREIVRYSSEKETNSLIFKLLRQGVDSFLIDLSDVLLSNVEIKKLLHNFKLSDTPFFFKVENQALDLVNELQKFATYQWKGGIINDAFGRWMNTGNWDKNHWKDTAELIRKVQNSPQFKVLHFSSHHFHNAGANVAQELAFVLAQAIETIDKLSQEGIEVKDILKNIEFSISIGTNYFAEIAKLRALKFLWKKILLEAYGFDISLTNTTSFHCQTSSYYHSAITPHSNLLRTTTEAMSAIIGGCDSISILSFDKNDGNTDDFGKRIARNISIILKEESYFDKVSDPSAGSYFIEKLTFEIAEESLKILEEVESLGGIMEAFKKSFIQEKISAENIRKQDDLQANKYVMVGVNKFRLDEKPFLKTLESTSAAHSDWELLPNLRLSESFEM